MLSKYTFIVVGGGIAGVSCVEALLTWLPEESVLLLSETGIVKAARNVVSIAKTLIQFDVEEETLEQFSEKHRGLDILLDKVIAVDSEAHVITSSTGKTFGYEKLCLCTGGEPKLISNNPYVIGIRDTDSVVKFQSKVKSARRVIICGNGGIASELVYELKNVEKIWIIKDQHISSVFLDAGAAEFIKGCLVKKDDQVEALVTRQRYTGNASKAALGPDWLQQRQLTGGSREENLYIEYGACVTDVISNGGDSEWPVHAVLDSGKIIHADLIVSATGVLPAGDFISFIPEKLRLADDGGILVDEMLCTSVRDVYGAGDVVTAGWTPAPHWLQMRLWTQARQMGLYAGRVMCATLRNEPILQDFCFEMFSHVTKFFGLKVILMGLFNAQNLEDYEFIVRVTPGARGKPCCKNKLEAKHDLPSGTPLPCSHITFVNYTKDHNYQVRYNRGKEYVKLVMQRGKVQGAVLIGETDLEEMCENLILDQLDVSFLGENLLDPQVDIDDYFD